MTRTKRKKGKTSPSCITREVTVQENVIKASKRKKPQEARSAHTLYHRTAEALTGPVCQGRQKAGQKAQADRQRGQGSQCICQRQDQRNNQRA
eukprot:12302911-Ditylum_brightwellii.AAC.1